MNERIRWPLVVGAGVLVGLTLLACAALLLGGLAFSPMTGLPRGPFGLFPRPFRSNGERIYFTATSASGQPIIAEMAGMHMGHPGMIACVTCHGPGGRGGTVPMMMGGTFVAPDIRYTTLIQGEHDEAHEDHPPYTDETIKRAITKGIDSAGEPLAWPMPRWRMSEGDLNDLLDYLKTLQ